MVVVQLLQISLDVTSENFLVQRNVLVGMMFLAFKRYGRNNAYKDNNCWLLLSHMDTLQRTNGKLRTINR